MEDCSAAAALSGVLLGCAKCLETGKGGGCSGPDIAQRRSLEEEPLECLGLDWSVSRAG